MGLINRKPALGVNEVIRWKRPASYCLDTRTVGGTLFVTSAGLAFVPNRLNQHRDKGEHRRRFIDIAAIGVQERTGTPYNGGLRRRVRIELHDGRRDLFIVKHPDAVVRELRSLITTR